MTRRGWLLFVALGVIWGLPYLLIKVSVREVSPPLLVFIRTGGGALVLLPLAVRRGALRPALRRWRAVVAYACAEMAVPWLFLFAAERRLSSSFTGLMVAAVPLAAAALAWATRSDRVDARRLVGVVLGLAGVGALVGLNVSGAQAWSVVGLLAVAAGYALGPWIVAQRLQGVAPEGVMALSFALCALAYAPAAALTLPTRPLTAEVGASVAGLTVVCTIVAFLVFFALVREVGAMRTTLITYVNPVVAVALGVAVLHEHLHPATGVGFVLILAGCLLATRPTSGAAPARDTPATDLRLAAGPEPAGLPHGVPGSGLPATGVP